MDDASGEATTRGTADGHDQPGGHTGRADPGGGRRDRRTGRLRRADLARGDGAVRPVAGRRPAQRDRGGSRPRRHRRRPLHSVGADPVAQGPSRGRRAADRPADHHRGPAAHGHLDPARPDGAGPLHARAPQLGGRATGAGTAHRDLLDRPPHRRGPGRLRPGRLDHPGLHRVPRAGRAARPGGRADVDQRVPLHAAVPAVRGGRLQPLAAARGRHGPRLPVAPAVPAAPAVRAHGRPVVAQVAGAPLAAGRAARRVPGCDRRAEPPRSAQGDRLDQRAGGEPAGDDHRLVRRAHARRPVRRRHHGRPRPGHGGASQRCVRSRPGHRRALPGLPHRPARHGQVHLRTARAGADRRGRGADAAVPGRAPG